MATIGGRFNNLLPPPRSVPFSLTVSSYFGGSSAQLGWFAILLALVPVWYVVQHKDIAPNDVFLFWGETVEVDGQVIALIEANHETVGYLGTDGAGYEHYWEKYQVLGLRYMYFGPDGSKHVGEAHGLTKADERLCNVGVHLPIEYVKDRPRESRAVGYRRSEKYWEGMVLWSYWIGLLLIIGSLPASFGSLWRGSRRVALLTRGVWTQAAIAWREPFTWLPTAGVMKVALQFSHGDREVEVVTTVVDGPDNPMEEKNQILFDAGNPQDAMLLRDFPGHIEVDENGALTEGDFNSFNYLWFPALCVMGYLLFVLDLMDVTSPGELLALG